MRGWLRATQFLEQAIAIEDKQGDLRGKAIDLLSLANVYAQLDEFEKARDYAEASRAAYLRTTRGDDPDLAALYLFLEQVYFKLIDVENANIKMTQPKALQYHQIPLLWL